MDEHDTAGENSARPKAEGLDENERGGYVTQQHCGNDDDAAAAGGDADRRK